MKARMIEQLRRCNINLKKHSWKNYHEFLSTVLRSIGHDVAWKALMLLQDKRYTELVEFADCVASTEYETPAEHLLCNQISQLVRKYPFPPGEVHFSPRDAATKVFLNSERKCSLVNRRFALYDSLRSPHEAALQSASSWISHVLGDLKLSEIWEHCDFGPGASIGIHGNATSSARKLLASEWSVTPSTFYYGYASLMQDIHIRELVSQAPEHLHYSYDNSVFMAGYQKRVTLVNHNKIAFVPKTVKVERTIAVEPLLNGYVQKGVDVFMRKRLKRVGINLEDQSRNQDLAREGSVEGSSDPYVTIDLSSASDSISIGLCKRILPVEWFEFLDSIRSRNFLLDGVVKPYHKFVTMGNGFCFPLETLIFASLCEVAYKESSRKADYSVYGDDIIVRQSVADRVLKLLSICGFKANTKKTFLKGPFRESCGADWFKGVDVRPLTLDYAFDCFENIVKFCNLARSKGTWECILSEGLEFLKSLIPKECLYVRPFKGNVDTALEVPWDEFLTSPFSRYHRKMSHWSWIEVRHTAWRDDPVMRFAGYNVVLTRGALTGSSSLTPFSVRRKTSTKICRVGHGGGWSLFLPGTIELPYRIRY